MLGAVHQGIKPFFGTYTYTVTPRYFDNSRLLPLDPSVVARLIRYVAERDRLIGHAAKPLFVTAKATRLADCSARYNFAQACQRIGLLVSGPTAVGAPRPPGAGSW